MPTYRRFGALIISACLFSTLFLMFSSGDVAAEPYYSGVERTWDAAANGLASNPARWDPVGVPATGDNITFDGTSVFNCNWYVEVTLGDFSMLTGYTGTVTQTADFGCVDWLLEAGSYVSSTSYWLTCQGNNTQTGGALSGNTLNVVMTGDETTFTKYSTPSIHTLRVSANITFTRSDGPYGYTQNLIIDSGKTITVASGKAVSVYVSGTLINNGVIAGPGTFQVFMHSEDMSFAFGTITAPAAINVLGFAGSSRTFTLVEDTVLSSTFNVYSSHATHTCTLISNNHTLSVTGAFVLGDRSTIDQGTGAWSFGSYSQTGEDSVFNQGAALTIGTDFTVSDGVFNAVGDMTVPGNWNTSTGDYVNDDNVVTLTGASKTLAMNADDSFWNVTVSGTYTMDTDTTVRLRATITGTVDGTGDFLEPAPEFTSTPWVKACPLTLYEYDITQVYWDELAIDSAPYWLNIYDGSLKGIPGENETGIYNISLTLTWNDMATYQNFTLVVCAEEISPYQFASFELAIALCFCFGIMLAGFKERMLLILAGLVWMVCGIAIFIDYGDVFLYVSVGLGASLLFKGAYDVWK